MSLDISNSHSSWSLITRRPSTILRSIRATSIFNSSGSQIPLISEGQPTITKSPCHLCYVNRYLTITCIIFTSRPRINWWTIVRQPKQEGREVKFCSKKSLTSALTKGSWSRLRPKSRRLSSKPNRERSSTQGTNSTLKRWRSSNKQYCSRGNSNSRCSSSCLKRTHLHLYSSKSLSKCLHTKRRQLSQRTPPR